MRRTLSVTGLFVLMLSTTILSGHNPAGANGLSTYIALGDSIAYGVGSSLPERRSYPVLVTEYIEMYSGTPVEMINLAVPGETAATFISEGQLESFTNRVNKLRSTGRDVDFVTLSLGGNEMLAARYSGDTERHAALNDFRDTFDAAVTAVRAEVGDEANIVLTTYYDISEGDARVESSDAWWIEQFNTVIRDTASAHGASIAAVDEAFTGNIEQYTHAPFDVHPKNQGFRAIARQVWSALRLDNVPPEIEIVSASGATRRTPTLQLRASDNVGIASVQVTVGGDAPLEPVDMGTGRYVLLLDLRGDNDTEYDISVEAVDSAGNNVRAEQRLVVQID